MIEIGEIRTRRKKLGITQKELAELVGVSQSLIAKLESGRLDPKLSLLKKVFSVLEELERKNYWARNIMNSPVIAANPSDTVRKVAKIMIEKGISQLPVIEDEKIVGSVTERGIFKAFFDGRGDLLVRDILEPPLPTVKPNESIFELSRLLLEAPAVLVVEGKKLLGIVTKHDIMRVNAR
ncbi:MAG: CBS domain-containing protein [Archaeoglobales archaeon]|jgi:predicted transcriptional regulator|nr:CBS domain-containing protein [Archaeoglobales archaeon]TDA25243.1 MAG: XRE family transcriptional regulator [Archaeoglobi archaeon]TDA25486.1 MAG: XRE family transcriptional regulator [Archaeoglobi archaeon]TDA27570.1 MAG: XRE family transcriptional regulator [Archaeoglobi archaeon]